MNGNKQTETKMGMIYEDFYEDKEYDLKFGFVEQMTKSELMDLVCEYLLDELVEIKEKEFNDYCYNAFSEWETDNKVN